MNKVIEAVKKDGTRQLIPTSLIQGYVEEAKIVAKGKGIVKAFGRMLANLMYVRNYVTLSEIRYDGEGNTKRVTLMAMA